LVVQQVGGLQALVPGNVSLAAVEPMPPTRRMRAHVDTWTPVTAETAARSKEVWPYAGTSKDGLVAVIGVMLLIMRATSFGAGRALTCDGHGALVHVVRRTLPVGRRHRQTI